MINTINSLGPLALAGYVGYFQYKKDRDNLQLLAIWAIGTYLLALWIVPKITGELKGLMTKPPHIEAGAEITPKIRQYTDSLDQDIYEKWGTRNSAIYATVAVLPNADLSAIYNDWQERYYSKDNQTLVQAMEDETYYFETKKNANTIISRLKTLI